MRIDDLTVFVLVKAVGLLTKIGVTISGLMISEAFGLGNKESIISSDRPDAIQSLTSFNSSVAFKYSFEAKLVPFVFFRS